MHTSHSSNSTTIARFLNAATPTSNRIALRRADFSTLTDALDYAAQGRTDCNFYTGKGELSAVLPYSLLRQEARQLARRLRALELERGSRIALIAETNPDFLRFFFACQYAGLVPVPLAVPVNMGNHWTYVELIRGLLTDSGARVAVAPKGLVPFLVEAAFGMGLTMVGSPENFDELPELKISLQPSEPTELAYLQYTSGSTRFPRRVMIAQATVMDNLARIVKYGVDMRESDRCMSWLPFYHDMGLVGLVLCPMASQRSVDYLDAREFAKRPRAWLELMSRSKATVSFGPPFGFELCAARVETGQADQFDLSAWRVAGVGAEMIRPAPLEYFAEKRSWPAMAWPSARWQSASRRWNKALKQSGSWANSWQITGAPYPSSGRTCLPRVTDPAPMRTAARPCPVTGWKSATMMVRLNPIARQGTFSCRGHVS